MKKILSNIVAIAVLIGILLFSAGLYYVMAFSLVAFAKVNGLLAVVISGVTSFMFGAMCGPLAQKLGIKLEF